MNRPPSLLEVLYPPKASGTRTFLPAYAPVVALPAVSESEKLCGLINGVIRGIGLTFLLGLGSLSALCILLLGSL